MCDYWLNKGIFALTFSIINNGFGKYNTFYEFFSFITNRIDLNWKLWYRGNAYNLLYNRKSIWMLWVEAGPNKLE